jgi:hypothetical protein
MAGVLISMGKSDVINCNGSRRTEAGSSRWHHANIRKPKKSETDFKKKVNVVPLTAFRKSCDYFFAFVCCPSLILH